MEPRISIITLGVTDFKRSFSFYNKGLGFKTDAGPTDQIAFFKLRGTVLAIYPLDKLAEDISPDLSSQRSGFTGVTLAHNVTRKAPNLLKCRKYKATVRSVIFGRHGIRWLALPFLKG